MLNTLTSNVIIYLNIDSEKVPEVPEHAVLVLKYSRN